MTCLSKYANITKQPIIQLGSMVMTHLTDIKIGSVTLAWTTLTLFFTLTSSIMPLKCFCNWVVLVKYGCSGFFQNDHTIWWCLTSFGKTETVRLGEAFLGHDDLTIFCSVFSFLPFLETSVTDWLLAVWGVTVSPYIKAEVLYGL